MFFDSHVHTQFSADSRMTAEAALRAAKQQGIGLVFTEHVDFSYPGEMKFWFSPEAYWAAYAPLRGDNLLLGAEVGLVLGEEDMAAAFLARAPFDEVIGSVHLLYGKDLYEADTYAGRTKSELYRDYLSLMARLVRAHPYIDTLGHIDYIVRYAPYDDPALRYEEYTAEIDAVLVALVETDTALELNTRRLGDALAAETLLPIYRRYGEVGGQYVTIGSDAHEPDAIGSHFTTAQQIAKTCGLTPVTFRARRPVKIFEKSA
ncbi:MAG: histidinol-phosphatase HisJ family protein [Schwartzia sp. (in: firmicutes)]